MLICQSALLSLQGTWIFLNRNLAAQVLRLNQQQKNSSCVKDVCCSTLLVSSQPASLTFRIVPRAPL